MAELECMVKWLRLAMLKRFSSGTNGTWKSYLQHIVSSAGGLFFSNCNYSISDYTIPSQFYQELLLWWSQFRETFATEEDWKTIIWNNKEIKVENKPVYYKHYVYARVIYIQGLLFSLNSTDSYKQLSKDICKTNIWAIENVLRVCIAWYKHERGWKNSRELCKPETKSRVCITVENSPNALSVYRRLCK